MKLRDELEADYLLSTDASVVQSGRNSREARAGGAYKLEDRSGMTIKEGNFPLLAPTSYTAEKLTLTRALSATRDVLGGVV